MERAAYGGRVRAPADTHGAGQDERPRAAAERGFEPDGGVDGVHVADGRARRRGGAFRGEARSGGAVTSAWRWIGVLFLFLFLFCGFSLSIFDVLPRFFMSLFAVCVCVRVMLSHPHVVVSRAS